MKGTRMRKFKVIIGAKRYFQERIKELQEEITILAKEKEEAIYEQEFEKAAQLRDKQKELKER